jgi:hypothetical protein
MTILATYGIYNVVIWTTYSCNHNQLQMAFTTSFVVVNVVVNATFWHCDSSSYTNQSNWELQFHVHIEASRQVVGEILA